MSEHLIDNLPEELLIHILSLLEPSELRQAGRVCRTWRRIVTDDSCWRRAFARTFTQRPFERLMPNRMPAKAGSSQSLVTSGRGSASSWQFEYLHRQRLIRQWQSIGGNGQTRLEYNVRASSVDKVIVSEKYGWALAVSMAGKVAIRSMPMTGKVFARDNDIQDIVFALPHVSEPGHWIDQGRASSLSTRIDRIVWGFDDGVVTVTHINKFGRLQSRTISRGSHVGPVLGSAGPLDQLTQHQHEWPAAYDIAGDDRVVASAGADGDVRVWSEDTGDLVCVLRGVFGTPLVKVSWAEGLHYVVAASSSGAVFVWDFEEAKIVTMETGYDYSESVDTSAPPGDV
ncbi:hypothetical protein DL89DRAFT_18195 [Linderina pennispora]|uniref:F-box domain-containing protein n=1 Tax=Linderina pennispora TaxID=61395 RepID=A0A1Y1WLY0_9FUNG|nr:uncharacterized protein DL89DRAFT_18195 [Linderina pennispora]ORX74513.1 hypothetical protein DL89DRAFT_18195 [Linderina pennispora]